MTDRELMQQVLEDICGAKLCEINSMSSRVEMIRLMDSAITALRERLAQPEQEPYGYFRYDLRLDAWVQNREGRPGTPFYTIPQQRKPWAGLTDEEIKKEFHPLHATGLQFARAIEAKLREKNHG